MTRSRYKFRKHLTAPTGRTRGQNLWLRRIASGVVLATLLLAATTLATANNLATEGKTSQEINQEIQALTVENTKLAVENASLTAVSRIYKEALVLGFVNPRQVETVSTTKPVALKDR